jgi:hypothetical protein
MDLTTQTVDLIQTCILLFRFRKSIGKIHSRTGHEGPEGEKRYSSTLDLTSALDGVGGERHAPAALPRERPGTLL